MKNEIIFDGLMMLVSRFTYTNTHFNRKKMVELSLKKSFQNHFTEVFKILFMKSDDRNKVKAMLHRY